MNPRIAIVVALAVTVSGCERRKTDNEVHADSPKYYRVAGVAQAGQAAAPASLEHIAFSDSIYAHNAGDAFTISATVYDSTGAPNVDRDVSYGLQSIEAGWFTGTQP